MKVVVGRPPVYDQIVELIGRPPSNAVFTWGDTLFIPSEGIRSQLDAALMEHENTHTRQQARAGGPEKWWERYLHELAFRLEQEAEAYQRQAAVVKVLGLPRHVRRNYERQLARDLSGPLYGHLLTRQAAFALITGRESLSTSIRNRRSRHGNELAAVHTAV